VGFDPNLPRDECSSPFVLNSWYLLSCCHTAFSAGPRDYKVSLFTKSEDIMIPCPSIPLKEVGCKKKKKKEVGCSQVLLLGQVPILEKNIFSLETLL
jgi:hypothetical protein